jgi:hypothetical protein
VIASGLTAAAVFAAGRLALSASCAAAGDIPSVTVNVATVNKVVTATVPLPSRLSIPFPPLCVSFNQEIGVLGIGIIHPAGDIASLYSVLSAAGA